MLHQFFRADCAIFHIGKARIDDFAQIMRRNIGRHADSNAASAIDQQIRESGRQNTRFITAAIIIGLEIDRILIEIFQQAHRRLGQPCFGVAHGGGWIGVHRAEIALTIHERQAHRPILRQTCQCVINRGVAMRVIITHHVADDLGRLTIRPTRNEAAFLGSKQYPAVNGL